MSEFLELISSERAWRRWHQAIESAVSPMDQQVVPLSNALGRVLAEPIAAPEALPPFRRSTVDGYALRSADSFGASEGLPAYLDIVGEMPMGVIEPFHLEEGESALVHTGGALPEGADAVVMLEDTQQPKQGELEVFKAAAKGANVLEAGEDISPGDPAFSAGRKLRPQDLGGLAALGITQVPVTSPPRVAILSTGDELVPPEAVVGPGQVRDVNSTTLRALVIQAGGEPINYGIVSDKPGELERAASKAKAESDLIMITAGSSVSERDRTNEVISGLGKPGVLVHGLSIKPGKPTILGLAEGTPALGLPGNPVSALVIAGLFLTPLIRWMLGQPVEQVRPQVPARLAINLASKSGREDYVPVRLEEEEDNWRAEPVFGRSNLIFTLIRADGLIRIPPQSTGLRSGEVVNVILF
ncbi:MAG: gephyrin-like molybdotransferase Glp [Anaerolineales bacterium]